MSNGLLISGVIQGHTFGWYGGLVGFGVTAAIIGLIVILAYSYKMPRDYRLNYGFWGLDNISWTATCESKKFLCIRYPINTLNREYGNYCTPEGIKDNFKKK